MEFFSLMEQSITLKKILLRQNQLSDMVAHSNKTHYSTIIANDQPRKSRQHSRKKMTS